MMSVMIFKYFRKNKYSKILQFKFWDYQCLLHYFLYSPACLKFFIIKSLFWIPWQRLPDFLTLPEKATSGQKQQVEKGRVAAMRHAESQGTWADRLTVKEQTQTTQTRSGGAVKREAIPQPPTITKQYNN